MQFPLFASVVMTSRPVDSARTAAANQPDPATAIDGFQRVWGFARSSAGRWQSRAPRDVQENGGVAAD